MENRKKRFVGTLVGCAVGDALGAPFEGKPRQELSQMNQLTDAFRARRGHPPGQYTDDTQQTIAIARSIVAVGKVDGDAIAREFIHLWESGEIIGAGPVANRAVERLIAGIPWNEAALPEDLAYNGAAMRVSPIGLWNYDRLDQLATDAEISSIVTHRHPLAIAGAIAIATAVAHVMTHSEISTTDFLGAVSQPIVHRSSDFAEKIRQLQAWLPLNETEVLQQIVSVSGQDSHRRGFGISVHVVSTVLMSLYAFLQSPNNYISTVERAIRAGGDVDSTAAISGAISGAYNGIDAIPDHLVRGIKDSNEVIALAEQLHDNKGEAFQF